jgi:serine/threonine-protein phosphatase 6 regulatory ankyrin repeat subunit B
MRYLKTSVSFILAFQFSFFVTVINGQVFPPADMQEESSDTINEEWTPERSIIELIKEKDCFTPVNMINSINDIDFCDKYGGTMLMYSSLNGCYAMAKVLLKRGANIDLKSNEGFTALHMASRNGHFDIVNLLLKKGAKADVLTVKGVTPLYMASLNGHLKVIELLIRNGAQIDFKSNGEFTSLLIASLREM